MCLIYFVLGVGRYCVTCECILAYVRFPCAVRRFFTISCPAGQQRILQGIDLVIKESVQFLCVCQGDASLFFKEYIHKHKAMRLSGMYNFLPF